MWGGRGGVGEWGGGGDGEEEEGRAVRLGRSGGVLGSVLNEIWTVELLDAARSGTFRCRSRRSSFSFGGDLSSFLSLPGVFPWMPLKDFLFLFFCLMLRVSLSLLFILILFYRISS